MPLLFNPRPDSPSNTKLVKNLKAIGVSVISNPLIELRPVAGKVDPEQLRKQDVLVCVSSLAADILAEKLSVAAKSKTPKKKRFAKLPPILVPGSSTALVIRGYGGKAVVPKGSGTPAIFAKLEQDKKLKGKNILIICGEDGGTDLLKQTKAAGAKTKRLELYKVLSKKFNAKQHSALLQEHEGRVDYVWVTSHSILKSLQKCGADRTIFSQAEIILGSPRLWELAEKMGGKLARRQLTAMPDPRNETLLKYLKVVT